MQTDLIMNSRPHDIIRRYYGQYMGHRFVVTVTDDKPMRDDTAPYNPGYVEVQVLEVPLPPDYRKIERDILTAIFDRVSFPSPDSFVLPMMAAKEWNRADI
jgi:hypothetical protein